MWISTKQPPLPFRTLLLKSEEVLVSVQKLVQQSNGLNLSQFSPELVPVFKQSTANKTGILSLFDGTRTFWDLASELKHPVTEIIRVCVPRYNDGSMELRTIEDLSPPIAERARSAIASANVSQTSEPHCFSVGDKQYCIEPDKNDSQDSSLDESHKPLVACLDDSLAMCLTLEKIIAPAGYRVLKIQNPLEEMSELVKSKPDLIILDLMMPDVNGYDLCKFLRQTPNFKKVPIVILTSSNDMVDIAKSQMAGASDFLNKPPQQEKVLEVIEKHLVSKV